MTIELKKISINTRLSEETVCYSADLVWNGKKVAEVSNHGHGGPDMVRVTDQVGFDAAIAFVKAMPRVESEYFPDGLPMDLELWCQTEVGKIEEEKRMRSALARLIKSKIVVSKDGQILTYGIKGVKLMTAEHVARFKASHPDAIILNTMPPEKALRIFSEQVA